MKTCAQNSISVYAHDQRGFGRTEGGVQAYTDRFDDYVDDAVAEIRAIKEKNPSIPVVVMGHSMGGLVSMRVGLAIPDEINGLILSAPLLKLSDNLSPHMLKLAYMLSYVMPTFYLPWSSMDRNKITPNIEVQERDAADPLIWHYGTRAGHAVVMVEAVKQTEIESEALKVKAYVFHGTADEICDIEGGRKLAAKHPELVIMKEYEGVVHSLLHEMPETSKRITADMIAAALSMCGVPSLLEVVSTSHVDVVEEANDVEIKTPVNCIDSSIQETVEALPEAVEASPETVKPE